MTRILFLFLAGCTVAGADDGRVLPTDAGTSITIPETLLWGYAPPKTWKCKRGHVMHSGGPMHATTNLQPVLYRFFEDGKEYASVRLCQRCLVAQLRKIETVEVKP